MEKETIGIELEELAKYCEHNGFIKATYVCYKYKINLHYIATILDVVCTSADENNVYMVHDSGITVLATVINDELYLNKRTFVDSLSIL